MKTIALCMFTIEWRNPWNQTQTHTHTVQEFGSPEHRDTAPLNANKFNLAVDEENIDFNISGVPDAMVKRSHGINVHNWIQQIENHPKRQVLQSDLQQHRAFNLFSKESKDAITAAGNTELCVIVDVEPKSQCRACLTYWDAGIVHCTCGHFLRDGSTSRPCWISSLSQTSTTGRADHTVIDTGRKVAKNSTRQNNFKRGVERNNTKIFMIDLSVTRCSERR